MQLDWATHETADDLHQLIDWLENRVLPLWKSMTSLITNDLNLSPKRHGLAKTT
jgi:hypothetical protein